MGLVVTRPLHRCWVEIARRGIDAAIIVIASVTRRLLGCDQSFGGLIALEWAIWRLALDEGVFLVEMAFVIVPVLLSEVYQVVLPFVRGELRWQLRSGLVVYV